MRRYGLFGMMLFVCVALVAGPSLLSAQKSEEPAQTGTVAGQEGKSQMKGAAEAPGQSKGKMDEYRKDLEKELRALDKKIAALGKKVKKEGSKLKAEAKESWNDVKAKQKTARNSLKRLSSAGEKGWEKAKAEAEAARDDLRKTYDKAVSYFK